MRNACAKLGLTYVPSINKDTLEKEKDTRLRFILAISALAPIDCMATNEEFKDSQELLLTFAKMQLPIINHLFNEWAQAKIALRENLLGKVENHIIKDELIKSSVLSEHLFTPEASLEASEALKKGSNVNAATFLQLPNQKTTQEKRIGPAFKTRAKRPKFTIQAYDPKHRSTQQLYQQQYPAASISAQAQQPQDMQQPFLYHPQPNKSQVQSPAPYQPGTGRGNRKPRGRGPRRGNRGRVNVKNEPSYTK